MQDRDTTGELHGAEADCKSADSGSTPALVSTWLQAKHFIESRPTAEQLSRQINALLPPVRKDAGGYSPDDFSAEAQHARQDTPEWVVRQLLLAFLARVQSEQAKNDEWKTRFTDISIENSRLKRECERLKRAGA